MEDVHHVRVFLAVAENLSFTRAAESLFLTQSAVSHQIARLEREIGATLFVRRGKEISLTPAAEALLPRARRIFSAMDEAAAAVRQTLLADTGRLRIGASAAACQFIIPEVLREFRESFPDYSLSIVPNDSPVIVQHLLDETVDLGLLTRPDRQPKLHLRRIFEDELGFVVSPLHPWAKAGKVNRRELPHQRMVLYSQGSFTFRLIQRYLTRAGAPLHEWIDLGDTGAIKELVKLGLGISIMAPWTVRPEVAERSLVYFPLVGSKIRRTWYVAYQESRPLSVAEQTFVGLCEAACGQLLCGS